MTGKFRILALTLITIIALAFGLILFLPSEEPNFDAFGKANEAFNMGNYVGAAEILEPLANEGDQRAVEYIAYMEAFGLGRPINRDKAKKWIAASEGDQEVGVKECSIGVYWANGHFGERDLVEAAHSIKHSNSLRGRKFCLDSFQGERLERDLRTQVEEKILEISTE